MSSYTIGQVRNQGPGGWRHRSGVAAAPVLGEPRLRGVEENVRVDDEHQPAGCLASTIW